MAYRMLRLAGAVDGSYGYVDSTSPLDARFNCPVDLRSAADGSCLYVADYGNEAIRRITLSGTFPVDTLATLPAGHKPIYLFAHASGNVYVTSRGGIFRISPGGTVTTVNGAMNSAGAIIVYPDEDYAIVKEGVGNLYVGWRMYDLATGAQIASDWNEGNLGRDSGMMETSVAGLLLMVFEYWYPSGSARGLGRNPLVGSEVRYVTGNAGYPTEKIIAGPDGLAPGYDTALYMRNGLIHWFAYTPGETTEECWISDTEDGPIALGLVGDGSFPSRFIEGLPAGGWAFTTHSWLNMNQSGTSNGVGYNGVVVAVPADDLTANAYVGAAP